jgi:hypothetical protein
MKSAFLVSLFVCAALVAGACSSSSNRRGTRRQVTLASLAAQNPTAFTVSLPSPHESPRVAVQSGRSGNKILDLAGDVAREGSAQALKVRLQKRVKLRDLNKGFVAAAGESIAAVFEPTAREGAGVIFELTIDDAALVAADRAGATAALMVVSARALDARTREVVWSTQESVQRDIGTFVPLPRGAGGLYNLAAVSSLSDAELKKVFSGVAAEAGRVVGRRIVAQSAR